MTDSALVKSLFTLAVALLLGPGRGELAAQTTWRSALYPANGYDSAAFDLETEKGLQGFSYAGADRKGSGRVLLLIVTV